MIEDKEIRNAFIHIAVLNEEMGVLSADMKWVKKILFAIAGMMLVGVGKVLFFG